MKPLEKAEARRLRREKGLSVKAIAKHLNVSVSSVSLWVRDIPLTKTQRAALRPGRRIKGGNRGLALKRKRARSLRREEGLSIRAISKRLHISTSSASIWVRDIILTEAQQATLPHGNPKVGEQGGARMRQIYLEKRVAHQEQGRASVRAVSQRDALHLAGCMLYWAEGAKGRNSVRFSNSDPEMVLLFATFLRECYAVNDTSFRLRIHYHENNGRSLEEIESYWLRKLRLERSNLDKSTLLTNRNKPHAGFRQNVLKYGVCTLCIHSTQLVQTIFGAIQGYGDFRRPEWLK